MWRPQDFTQFYVYHIWLLCIAVIDINKMMIDWCEASVNKYYTAKQTSFLMYKTKFIIEKYSAALEMRNIKSVFVVFVYILSLFILSMFLFWFVVYFCVLSFLSDAYSSAKEFWVMHVTIWHDNVYRMFASACRKIANSLDGH